ncbi:MAG TPA: hypothetical protein VFK02_17655 [Kofleriaceae bacterium]|nr:hypothetical protein [Kofleriaceae bacterium]
MSMIRTVAMLVAILAVPVASSRAFAEPPKPPPEKAEKAPDKASDKKADKPAAPAPAPADKPVAKETVSDADAQRFYAFIERLIAIVVANQDDCVKMAAGVNAHVDANTALLKDASELRHQNKQLPPAIKEKMARKFKDELEPAITRKCSKDKPVQDAFKRIDTR